jgi:hypothetical protein
VKTHSTKNKKKNQAVPAFFFQTHPCPMGQGFLSVAENRKKIQVGAAASQGSLFPV